MKTDKNSELDASGDLLKEGDLAILLEAPDELLSGLPVEDQMDIKSQVGFEVEVQSFDEYGNVELEFTSKNETIHFIWVKPLYVRKI